MSCFDCPPNRVIHEQFEGYKGRWICFHPKKNSDKCIICETPVEDFGDKQAHRQTLKEASVPKWCPLKEKK